MTVDLPGRPGVDLPPNTVRLTSALPYPQTAASSVLIPVQPEPPRQPEGHPHWAGLDGLRAIAVIAVVAFHFFGPALPGGFIGVDVFFGISGYLITRLLIREWVRAGWIDLRQFYRRRARRLLPALAIVLAAVCVAALFWRDQLATLRPAVLAAAVFGSNWWLALAHQSYFVASGRPTMLQHLWSLGVEEQFYLVWPVLVIVTLTLRARAVVRRGGQRVEAIRAVLGAALVLAAGSTAVSWWLADRQHLPYGGSGSLLYYGTDTHSMGLFLGAALGAWAMLRQYRPEPLIPPSAAEIRLVAVLRTAAAAGALGGLLWLAARVDSFWYWLYRGGFALVGILVCIVIAAATPAGSRVGAALDWRPLRWVGVRSYSIYLWHWPVALVTRPGLDNNLPVAVDQALRISLVVVLSDLTYRLVESPARRFGVRGAVRAVGRHLRASASAPAPTAGAGLLVTLAMVALAVVVVGPAAPQPAAAAGNTAGGRHLQIGPVVRPVSDYAPGRPLVVVPRHRPAPKPSPAALAARHDRRAGRTRPAPVAALPRLSGFGDSVLLDARAELGRLFPGGSIDALIGRQPADILADVIKAARAGRIAPVVVLHAGDNGLIDPAQLTRALADLSQARVVLVLNLHLDPYADPWQRPNNATIERLVPKFRNAHLVDWDAAAGAHPGWLYPDGIHLTPQGATGYARLVATAARQYL